MTGENKVRNHDRIVIYRTNYPMETKSCDKTDIDETQKEQRRDIRTGEEEKKKNKKSTPSALATKCITARILSRTRCHTRAHTSA